MKQKILQVSKKRFSDVALEIFHFQAHANLVYRNYINKLRRKINQIQKIEEIPFLPISFFKTQKVICKDIVPMVIFESSGTTGQKKSRHYIASDSFYQEVSQRIFESFYGNLNDFHILALLPSYLERKNTSLVCMIQHFMKKSVKPSGFFLHNNDELIVQLQTLSSSKKKILLIGVTFALLELARKEINLSNCIIMETGGMKGRGKEKIRKDVHAFLKNRFNVRKIHSEYGMTELLSQCYSLKNGVFHMPPWYKILLREINDPFAISKKENKKGALNIIDLANIDSCAFIESQDIGMLHSNGTFSVLGRMDNSDMRGCNLLF